MVHRGLLVCGVVGCSLRLVAVDDLLHPGGQGLLQPPGLGREGRQAGARAGQNEAGQSARAAQGVLQGEPTALGVTEHVDVVEPQGIAHGGDLLEERWPWSAAWAKASKIRKAQFYCLYGTKDRLGISG